MIESVTEALWRAGKQRVHQRIEILRQRRGEYQRLISNGVRQPHLKASQQQAMEAEQLLKQPIVSSLAVGGVADDRVPYRYHFPLCTCTTESA